MKLTIPCPKHSNWERQFVKAKCDCGKVSGFEIKNYPVPQVKAIELPEISPNDKEYDVKVLTAPSLDGIAETITYQGFIENDIDFKVFKGKRVYSLMRRKKDITGWNSVYGLHN